MKNLAFIVLGLLICYIVIFDNANSVAGFQPLQPLELAMLETYTSKPEVGESTFFEKRNNVEVTVPNAMTVKEFLQLYDIDRPETRWLMACQLGVPRLNDNDRLPVDTVFKLQLTPSPIPIGGRCPQ